MTQQQIVIGIDGGGSYTRAAAADLEGNILAYTESGGANPYHNKEAKHHIKQAIAECISQAGCREQDVAVLAAGFAGIDQESDYDWAQEFIRLPSSKGIQIAVSDAKVAQIGALKGQPGIIAISGTGSIVFGINEAGKELRNYDFHQYAASTARHLSYETVYHVIAGEYMDQDVSLVKRILECWKVEHEADLAVLGSEGFIEDRTVRNRKFGEMAPIITSGAKEGFPLARKVCDTAAYALAIAIKLVGSTFTSDRIPVSFIGSVLRTPYLYDAVKRNLQTREQRNKSYVVEEPAYTPVIGALFLAYEKLKVDITEGMQNRLSAHKISKYQEY